MKAIFSVGRVLISITIFGYLTLGQVQAQAQVQAQHPKAPPQSQQKDIAPPTSTDEKELIGTSSITPDPFEEKHKDKSAIFLLDETSLELNEDWSYITKEHMKLKILKEEARYMGEMPLFYEKGREKIVNIKAYTTTPDGKKHRYSKIQDLKTYKGYAMYSDLREKVITLPQVNVGSILEYEATTISKESPIKNAFWEDFDFNYGFPAKEVKLTFTFPKQLGMQYEEFNLKYKPTITETDSTITYSWHIENIDNYTVTEGYLPPPSLNSVKNIVEFTSIKSWRDVSGWYYSLIQENLIINSSIEKATKKAIKNYVSTKDKVRAILEYIQENFRYVSMSFGKNTLEPHQTDQVFRNKYGDCKDLSLLCMAMLKLAGVKSYIALFNGEFSITDPQYDPPFPTLFNHVLLLVEDPEEDNFYIDPLLDGYDIGQYPLYYQGGYTFVITEDGGKFDRFSMFDEKKRYSYTKRTITIAQDGSASIESEALFDLDFSIKMRDMLNAMDDEEKKLFFRMLDTKGASGGKVLERQTKGLDEKYGHLTSYVKLEHPNLYPVTDDMIIIDLPGYGRGFEFSEEKRKNPIFYPMNTLKENTETYRIPEGFRISHMPKDLNLDIGFFSIKKQYKKKGDEIIVTNTQRHKRLELPKEDYKKVKDFFDQLPQKTDQRIVLKKTKPWWQEVKDLFARFRKSRQ